MEEMGHCFLIGFWRGEGIREWGIEWNLRVEDECKFRVGKVLIVGKFPRFFFFMVEIAVNLQLQEEGRLH